MSDKFEGADSYEPRIGVDLYAEVAERIIMPTKCPYLIYGIGIARSGTTASLNVMTSSKVRGIDGSESHIQASYQHFKAGYRHAMHNWPTDSHEKRWEFKIPNEDLAPVFYIKDPLGPYTKTESLYNPLKLLELKGYPKNKLFLLFFFRDPIEVLASWKTHWGNVRDVDILRDNLVLACNNLKRIHQQACEDGFANGTYLYEAMRDHTSEAFISKVFEGINIHMRMNTGRELIMSKDSVSAWNVEQKSRIWHPDEPEIYRRPEIAELHKEASSKPGLVYKKYTDDVLAEVVSIEDRRVLDEGGVHIDYEYFRKNFISFSSLEVRCLNEAVNYSNERLVKFK